jgi:hypothetical protein
MSRPQERLNERDMERCNPDCEARLWFSFGMQQCGVDSVLFLMQNCMAYRADGCAIGFVEMGECIRLLDLVLQTNIESAERSDHGISSIRVTVIASDREAPRLGLELLEEQEPTCFLIQRLFSPNNYSRSQMELQFTDLPGQIPQNVSRRKTVYDK